MTQPEALQVADMLEAGNSGYPSRAAAELRRLHAELERCKQVCAATAEGWRVDAALAEPVQEPVAWMVYTLDGKSVCVTDNPADFIDEHRVLPLYTTPTQRKPLTEEEIDAATAKERDALLDHIYEYGTAAEGVLERIRKLCRAVERAHGIVACGDSKEQP